MKIHPIGPELFHANGQNDIADEAYSSLFAILGMRLKIVLCMCPCFVIRIRYEDVNIFEFINA